MKRHDSLEPYSIVKSILEPEKLVEEIKRASHPVFVRQYSISFDDITLDFKI